MRRIRKFVGCVRVAAVLGAVVVLGLSIQPVSAHVAGPTSNATSSDNITLSSDCLAAIQAIRDALVADRQEDADEAANPNPSAEATEDPAEASLFTPLVSNLKTACAAAIAAIKAPTTVTEHPTTAPSAACTSAVQAWKAYARSLWEQHSFPTAAQQAQLHTLGQAVRSACGVSWSDWSSDHR